MNNLDNVIMGVGTYDETAEQLRELLDALWQLERDHPGTSDGETVQVQATTFNDLLTAYRKLIA